MQGRTLSPFARTSRSFRRNGLKAVVTVGAAATATALIEAVLIPGLAIGAAAIVIPGLLVGRPGHRTRPSKARAAFVRREQSSSLPTDRPAPITSLARSLRLKEATLKTVSFRVIVTTLDFGFNFIVLGDLITAAGLSTISIVAGPFFYFLHETGWTYIQPRLSTGSSSGDVQIARSGYEFLGRRVSHALAKTVTYRLFATLSEFSTNYIVVRDLTTAAWLSSFGFFIGPFVYFAHERLWERLQADGEGMTGQRVPALVRRLG